MTSECQPNGDAWSRRALTLALYFAYAPVFVASPFALKEAASHVRELGKLWGLALYALASSGVVGFALLALAFAARWLSARTRKRLFIFLLSYWLPHTLLIVFWGFVEAVGRPGALID